MSYPTGRIYSASFYARSRLGNVHYRLSSNGMHLIRLHIIGEDSGERLRTVLLHLFHTAERPVKAARC